MGLLCGEIAAVKRQEEEEKQRKKAKLAAKLRKLMEAEAKSERKRYIEIKMATKLHIIVGENHQIEGTRNIKRKERKRKGTKHMKQNQAHLHQIMQNSNCNFFKNYFMSNKYLL